MRGLLFYSLHTYIPRGKETPVHVKHSVAYSYIAYINMHKYATCNICNIII
jgi:uncharacterized membrane protein YukC